MEDLNEEVIYWKTRCELAEAFIKASPCDPDITSKQIEAYQKYMQFLKDDTL